MSDYIKVELTEEQYDKISRIGFTKLEVASIGCKMTIGGGSSDFEMTLMDKDRFNQQSSDSEALDMIGTTSKQVESLVNNSELPNGSGWSNGDECVYMTHNVVHQFIGPCPKREGYGYIQAPGFEVNFVELSKLSKPESQEQQAERERIEFIDSMFIELNPRDVKELYEGHRNSSAWKLCAKVYDAGHRKESK